jgi:DNA-binding beta-propeller fold protein YncE
VLLFDREGNFVSCWGEGYFVDPHGIYVGPDDSVYVTDSQTHTVEKLTPGGTLLNLRLGTRNRATDLEDRQPFNKPTSLSLGPKGDMFVCNGYGNFLVHKFSPDGRLLKTWGEYGKGPGQFTLPHKLDVDRHGVVYVCDRNNDRVQLFTSDGEFVGMWTDFCQPQDLCVDKKDDVVYVVEGQRNPPCQPRISVRDLKGNVLSEFGGRESEGKGPLEVSHSICVDSHGDLYIGDIVTAKRIQKFIRVS